MIEISHTRLSSNLSDRANLKILELQTMCFLG